MMIDMTRLLRNLSSAKAEETVPTEEVQSYLLENIIKPLMNGVKLRYGDVDFSKFDIDDLRAAASYCESLGEMSHRLEGVVENITKVRALSCKSRAFC